MRIALSVTEFPTISQTFVLDHVAGLLAHGHRVEVQAARPVPARARLELDWLAHVPVHLPPLQPRAPWQRLLAAAWQLSLPTVRHPLQTCYLLTHPGEGGRLETLWHARALREHLARYELLHAHSGQNGRRLLPLLAAARLATPLVVTFHGHDVHGHLHRRPAGYYDGLFSRADALIVCSGFMRERLLALGAPADKLHLIPNPVAAGDFPYRPRQAPAPEAPVELLSIGRLVAFKGTATLLQALAGPALRVRNWRLHLVGDGPLRATLQAQAGEAGLGDKVLFHGALPRERIKPLMERSALYLGPAIRDAEGNTETQGVALLEAMAAGLPVIASAVGGIPETLGETAVALVPPGDVEALAAAIVSHLDQPTRWPAHSAAGRKRTLADYQPELWLNRLDSLYQSLLRSPSRGNPS